MRGMNSASKGPLTQVRRLVRRLKGASNPPQDAPKAKSNKHLRTQALAYRHLAATLEGRKYSDVHPRDINVAPSPDEERSLRRAARLQRIKSQFAEDLGRGLDLGHALVQFAKRASEAEARDIARPLICSLMNAPATREDACIARAVLGARNQNRPFAWTLMREAQRERVLELAFSEFFAAAFSESPEEAKAAARDVLKGKPSDFNVEQWLALFESAFGRSAYSEANLALQYAETAFAMSDDESTSSPGELSSTEIKRRLGWYRQWSDYSLREQKFSDSQQTAGKEDRIHFGVMTYDQVDLAHSSSNLGDYTQTISATSHLLRQSNLVFFGEEDLVSVIEGLHARVAPERRIDGPQAEVELHLVRRDMSSLDECPPRTWMLWFGWHMHNVFEQRVDFPPHPNIEPLIVSFHVNRLEMLTPETIEYLKGHGPVGCRDWATTYLLLSAGVEAFFSGCLTTTVDNVFPEKGPVHTDQERRLWVDAKNTPKDVPQFKQEQEQTRTRAFKANMDDALEKLDWYRTEFNAITTSRLHSCLPSRAIGLPVDFRAKNPADIRFEGLIGLDDQEFASLQESLRQRLAPAIDAVVSGKSPSEVRGIWTKSCEADVALARKKLETLGKLESKGFDVQREVDMVRATRVDVPRTEDAPSGDEVHIEVSLDGNLKHQLEVVLDAVEAHSTRPLHIYVLSRDHEKEDHQRIARLFPQMRFTWFACDDIDYGGGIRLIRFITVATMDRLLLPDLLPELDRIIHLDLDTLPLEDLGQLWGVELGGAPLAARTSPWDESRSGMGGFMKLAKRMRENAEQTNDFLKRVTARHQYDFEAFNAGLMVMDLQKMRADNFCTEFLPVVEHFGLHDQDLLNFYAGSSRACLEDRWNTLPRLESLDGAALIHWAGPEKPWKKDYTPGKELWASAEDRLEKRRRKYLD